MYVRSYKTLPQNENTPQLPPQIPEQITQTQKNETKPQKNRFKARRKMPEFHPPNECQTEQKNENEQTHNLENHEKSTPTPIFTQGEMLVLAITVLLLLEGTDDILILALGYTLCP